MELPKVAVVSPNVMPLVDRFTYGGTERTILELTTAWSEDYGMPVQLYCAEGSKVDANDTDLIEGPRSSYPAEILDGSYGAEYMADHYEDIQRYYEQSLVKQDQYEDFVVSEIARSRPDVINTHIHSCSLLKKLKDLNIPLVANLHNDTMRSKLPELSKGVYVALSDSQRERTDLPPNNIQTVLGGVATFASSEASGQYSLFDNELINERGYLLYVGAISRRKGVKTAIDIAKSCNRPIVIAGPVIAWSKHHYKDTVDYFMSDIKPHVDGKQVMYISSINDEQRSYLMRNADATIVASAHEDPTWQESFGRVVPESLQQGTPLIISRRTKGAADRLKKESCITRFDFGAADAININENIAVRNDCVNEAKKFDMQRYSKEMLEVLIHHARLS